MFWFCAQTGIIYDERPQGGSNYAVFKIAAAHRAKVEAAVNAATFDSKLVYPDGFLEWLLDHPIDESIPLP